MVHTFFNVHRRSLLLAGLACMALSAAAFGEESHGEESHGPESHGQQETSDSDASSAPRLVVILGDSLSAGYGLSEEEAYPTLVESTLRERGHDLRVVNAGVSGDTLAGGLGRLPWLMGQKPDWVVIALGANDGLRGLPLEHSEETLRNLVSAVREGGARPIIFGMELPTNYGETYRQAFAQMFATVAEEMDVPLLPFLLEGVAMKPELNLGDRIHPNAAGHQVVAQQVSAFLHQLWTPSAEQAEQAQQATDEQAADDDTASDAQQSGGPNSEESSDE